MPVDQTESPQEAVLRRQYDEWFSQIQALSPDKLNPDDWVTRWFDGYTPQEALEDGPEPDND
jgi:hypothetical protein